MWLMFGTLLGVVRDGKLMDYDTDVDAGIFRRDTLAIAAAMKELCKDYGFTFIRNVCLDNTITIMRDDEYVDFSVFTENAIWYLTLTDPMICVLKDYQLDNLQPIKFLGAKFSVPQDYERDLVIWYGKDWRTPKKGMQALTGGYHANSI